MSDISCCASIWLHLSEMAPYTAGAKPTTAKSNIIVDVDRICFDGDRLSTSNADSVHTHQPSSIVAEDVFDLVIGQAF